MRRLVFLAFLLVPTAAAADEPCPAPLAVREWAPSPVALARELLTCARGQDEAALADEKAIAALTAELPVKRAAAKAAREAAKRAPADKKVAAEALAEDLEAEVIIIEADISARRNAAVEERRAAKDLRARAVRLVQGNTAEYQRSRGRQSDIF